MLLDVDSISTVSTIIYWKDNALIQEISFLKYMTVKNGLGKKYASQAKELYSWNYIEYPSLQKIFKEHKNVKKVLDLGCGDGRVFPMYMDIGVKEKDIYGIDIDSDLVGIAKKNFPNANLKVSDIRKKNLISEKVDLITSIHVLHYFNKKELEKIFKHSYERLKRNGSFIFVVAHPIRWVADDLSQYILRKEKEISTPWGTKMSLFCNTLEDYVEAMTKAGFLIKHILEPIPVEEGKADSESYKKYTGLPVRLLVEGVKRD